MAGNQNQNNLSLNNSIQGFLDNESLHSNNVSVYSENVNNNTNNPVTPHQQLNFGGLNHLGHLGMYICIYIYVSHTDGSTTPLRERDCGYI